MPFAEPLLEPTNGIGPQPRRQLAILNDSLLFAWGRGWLERPELDPDVLIARARKLTGYDDLGCDDGWGHRLELLTDALERDENLTALGRVMAHGQLVAALGNRARMQALWRKHPEILERPIVSPLIVLGQMRSGTTRMQRLLACDHRLAHTRFFESWNPVPAKPGRGIIDDRIVRGWLALRFVRWLNPAFDAIHPTGVMQPDEEIGFHSISLFGSAFEAQWRIPAFAAHCEQIDSRPVYAEFKRLLQTIAWMRGETRQRPWILKTPQMMQDLAAVLEIFPDARLIGLNRPVVDVVASSASLVENQMSLQYEAPDRRWIGREWVRKVMLRDERAASARATFAGPQIDLSFDAIATDWRAAIRKVYRMLDLPLADPIEKKMAAFIAAPRHAQLAGHRYSLDSFGLTPAHLRSLAPGRPFIACDGCRV